MTPYYNTITAPLQVRVNNETIADIMSACVYNNAEWYSSIHQTDFVLYNQCKRELYDTRSERLCSGATLTEYLLRGGTLCVEDSETDDEWTLTLQDLLQGIQRAVPRGLQCGWIVPTDDGSAYCIDTCSMDSVDADCLLQYALFGEIVFG